MDGDAGYDRWELKGIWSSRICPRRLLTEETCAWMHLYNHYEAGHLAVSGGVLDQPAIYLDAMRAIDIAVSNVDA